MRYTQLIKEANYKSKFDTSITYNSEAQFKSTVGSKFGALKGGPARESKPQAGGAVYLMDPDKGIVGYKVPKDESPSGFIWYAVKEPFMPATKGTKKGTQAPAQAPAQAQAPAPKATPKPAAVAKVELSQIKPASGFGGEDIRDFGEFISAIKASFGNIDIGSYQTQMGDKPNQKFIAGGEYIMYDKKTLATVGRWHPWGWLIPDGTDPSTTDGTGAVANNPNAKPKLIDKNKLTSVLNELLRAAKSAITSSYGRYDTHDVQDEGDRFACGIRDWGVWEMPEGEEDDGDYDWEVLSSKSAQQMQAIVKQISAKHPDVKITWTTEEKNWIMFFAQPK